MTGPVSPASARELVTTLIIQVREKDGRINAIFPRPNVSIDLAMTKARALSNEHQTETWVVESVAGVRHEMRAHYVDGVRKR